MIVLRSDKGSELDHAEVDENFKYLDEKGIQYSVGKTFRSSVIVLQNGYLYRLNSNVIFPYVTVDFNTELNNGDWILVGNSSQNDQIVALGVITLAGQDLTIPAGISWKINNVNYIKNTDTVFNIAYCATGLNRKDKIYVNNLGQVLRAIGNETAGIVVSPTLPNNTILVTEVSVSDSIIGTPTPPILGTEYLKKSYYQHYDYNGTGADAVIPIPATGYTEIRLKNASLTSVSGFDASLLVGALEQPFQGKQFLLWNNTGNDVTIKHDDNAIADIPFFLLGEANIVMPDNQMMLLKYDAAGFYEVMKSWGISEAPADGKTYGRKDSEWSEVKSGTLISWFHPSWNCTTQNQWRRWQVNTSRLYADTDNGSIGTGIVPDTSIYFGSNVLRVSNKTKLSKLTLSFRSASLHTIQLFVESRNFVLGETAGSESNSQILINESFTISQNMYSKSNFTINTHTLNSESIIYLFFRKTSATAADNILGVQLDWEFE